MRASGAERVRSEAVFAAEERRAALTALDPRTLATLDPQALVARDVERAAPSSFSTVDALLMPLLHRVRLGEGGLIGMATWAAALQSRDVVTTTAVFVLTSALLAAVYLYNDISDRTIDSYNPAKVAEHRAPLLRRPRLFFAIALVTHVVVALASWQLLGAWAATWALTLLALNPLYSGLAKRLPGVDVVIVGVMGAAVVGMGTSVSALLLVAGGMTAISHAFQTRGDSTADRAAGVQSSATAPAPVRELIWLASCAFFAWTVYRWLGVPWAVSVLIPYLLLSRAPHAERAWHLARIYFAVVWVAATLR